MTLGELGISALPGLGGSPVIVAAPVFGEIAQPGAGNSGIPVIARRAAGHRVRPNRSRRSSSSCWGYRCNRAIVLIMPSDIGVDEVRFCPGLRATSGHARNVGTVSSSACVVTALASIHVEVPMKGWAPGQTSS